MSTAIQWTDETWNPTTGCTRVSEGCRNCYIERTPAFRMAGRKFVNGTTGVTMHHDRLKQPLHWKKPRRVFVNSLSDLFHHFIPTGFLLEVFKVMQACPQHTFQILTKRPDRMKDFFDDPYHGWVHNIPNVWLGVSVEDQKTAEERIPLILTTPAAIRFISAEPLLGPIELSGINVGSVTAGTIKGYLDWVIVGGESGTTARPCDVGWIRSIVKQCQSANVPVFVKQLGAKAFKSPDHDGGTGFFLPLKEKKGGDPAEWPQDLRVREFPR